MDFIKDPTPEQRAAVEARVPAAERRLMKAMAEGFAPAVKDLIETAMTPLHERISQLEARPAFEDAGVWGADKIYKHGHGLTHDGSFWIAQRDTRAGEKPGASDAFRLAVKRGRDGKDSR